MYWRQLNYLLWTLTRLLGQIVYIHMYSYWRIVSVALHVHCLCYILNPFIMERFLRNGKELTWCQYLRKDLKQKLKLQTNKFDFIISKSFGVINKKQIIQYLMDNNIVTHYQHGFVSKKSCLQIFKQLLKTGLQQSIQITASS